jgi:hypothetical protein
MGCLSGSRNYPDHYNRARVVFVLEGKRRCPRHVICPNHYPQEDAYSIWSGWASCYHPESEERKLLEGIRDRRWLINVIHHDYQNPRALWDFIFSDGYGGANGPK